MTSERQQRRYLEGLRWETELPPKIDLRERLQSVAYVVIGVVAFVAVLVFMQNRDLRVKAEIQEAVAARYAAMLAQCMNGGALHDKKSNTAYFCQRVVALKLQGV